jgi:hypothetical protein
MPLPGSGFLQLGTDGSTGRSINSEFGLGNDMASYLGVYYGIGGTVARFPVSGNSISMQAFYSTSKITGGSAGFSSTQSYVIPIYNTITITATGGSGGGGGAAGFNGCIGAFTNGSPGNAGGGSSFFTVFASGGAGGAGNSGAGSPGQTVSQTFTNPVQGGSGPVSGSTITVSIGGGGAGGAGGANAGISGGVCYPFPAAAGGAAGSPGFISISWS